MPLLNESFVGNKRYASAFGWICWGVVFHLPLFGFAFHIDPLPDIFGWILIAIVLRKLQSLHSDVPFCTVLAWALAPVSLYDLAKIESLFTRSPILQIPLPLEVLYVIGWAAMAVLFYWKLCGIVADMAMFVKRKRLARKARFLRWLLVLSNVLIACSLAVMLLLIQILRQTGLGTSTCYRVFVTVPLWSGAILATVAYVMIIVLLLSVRRLCMGSPQIEEPSPVEPDSLRT